MDRETLFKNMEAVEQVSNFTKADLISLRSPVQNEIKTFSQTNIDEYEKTRVMALDRLSRLYYATLASSENVLEYMKGKKV